MSEKMNNHTRQTSGYRSDRDVGVGTGGLSLFGFVRLQDKEKLASKIKGTTRMAAVTAC